MRVGAFDITPPEPPLREPHAVAMLRPWINVGNVGSVALGHLKRVFNGWEVGRLARPGEFYDFTRYRPEIKLVDGQRQIAVPNTVVLAARRETPPDLLLVHLLEPHHRAEDFNDSVLAVFDRLNVTAYVMLGGMYDSVPHSRELIVTGSARGWDAPPDLSGIRLSKSNYEGPTSITNEIAQRSFERGMATLSLIVHMPRYLQLDTDFAGGARLLQGISAIYDLGDDLPEIALGEKQYERVTPAVLKDPQLAKLVHRLEREYDSHPREVAPRRVELSPEIERFLNEVGGGGTAGESGGEGQGAP